MSLKIYAINLDRRVDRWSELLASSLQFGLSPQAIERVSAVEDSQFGALGCAKSHLMALSHFLVHDTAPYCLILEDDFDLTRSWSEFIEIFNKVVEQRLDWDVLLLMGTAVLAVPEPHLNIARIIEAQSAAAYLVQRRYVPQLLGCFADCVPHLEKMRSINLRDFVTSRHAIDQAWKFLQRRDHWYILSPSLGRQRPSYSDIEQKHVDYTGITYAGR